MNPRPGRPSAAATGKLCAYEVIGQIMMAGLSVLFPAVDVDEVDAVVRGPSRSREPSGDIRLRLNAQMGGRLNPYQNAFWLLNGWRRPSYPIKFLVNGYYAYSSFHESLLDLHAVEGSLAIIAKDLGGVQERREQMLRQSRDVIAAASNAIVNTHLGKSKSAAQKLGEAERVLRALRRLGKDDLKRYLVQPETEYVEAHVVAAVAGREALPSARDLQVSGAAYLLGLLDAVGEMKRLVYDRIRQGRPAEASRLFGVMERLYALVSPFAVHDHVAPGIRRKLDVARILIEDTRAAVTEEIRRAKFITAMEKLSERLPGVHR